MTWTRIDAEASEDATLDQQGPGVPQCGFRAMVEPCRITGEEGLAKADQRGIRLCSLLDQIQCFRE